MGVVGEIRMLSSVYNSIKSIDKNEWDSLNSCNNIFLSYEFLKIFEENKLISQLYYLIIRNKKPVAKAVFSFIDMDITEILPYNLKNIFNILLRLTGKSRYTKIMYVGIPIAFSCSGIHVRKNNYYNTLIDELFKVYNSQDNVKAMCVTFLDDKQAVYINNEKLKKFKLLPDYRFINTFKSFREYKKMLRRGYLRHIESIEKDASFCLKPSKQIDDHDYSCYLNLCNRAEFKFTKFSKAYLNKLLTLKNVFCYKVYKNNEAVGFFILLESLGEYIFLCSGAKYIKKNKEGVYFFILNNIFKLALREHLNIHLGATTDFVKMRYGATKEDRYFLVHVKNRFFYYIIKLLKMNIAEIKQVHPFKNA